MQLAPRRWLRSFAKPTALESVSKSALTCVSTTPRGGSAAEVAAGDPGTCQSLGVGGSWKSSSSSPSFASQDPPKPSLGVARHAVRAARRRRAWQTRGTSLSSVVGSGRAPRRVGPVDRRRPTSPSLRAHALAEANAGVGSARSMRAGSRARRGRRRRGSTRRDNGVRAEPPGSKTSTRFSVVEIRLRKSRMPRGEDGRLTRR